MFFLEVELILRQLLYAKFLQPISWQKKSKCWACSIHIYIKWILNSGSIHSIWDSLIDFKVLRVTFSKLYASLYAPDYVPV